MFKIFQNKWLKIFICGPWLPFSSSPVLARVLISLVCHPLKVTMKLLNQHQILIRRNPHTYLPRVLLSDTFSNAKTAMASAIATKPITFSILILLIFSISLCNSTEEEDPTPASWPHQFHSILFMNHSGSLQMIDLWYDWVSGRNFNIIQDQLSSKVLYDLEWNNGTSFFYTLDSNKECRTVQLEVGILRPNWLDGANYLGQRHVDGFLCNVWEKVDFIWYYEDVVTKRPVHWVFYSGRYS